MDTNLNKTIKPLNWSSEYRKGFQGIYIPKRKEKIFRWLVSTVEFLNHAYYEEPAADIPKGYPLALMSSYFSQWLLTLCLELKFSDQFKKYNLNIFEATEDIGFEDIGQISDAEKFNYLLEIFIRTYDVKSPIRMITFSAWSLREVTDFTDKGSER